MFLNSAILLPLANEDAYTWFESGGLAYTASFNLFVMSVQTPIQIAIGDILKKKIAKLRGKMNDNIT